MLFNFNHPIVETKKILMLVKDLFDAHIPIPFHQSFALLTASIGQGHIKRKS